MKKKHKKNLRKNHQKPIKKLPTKGISFVPLYVILGLALVIFVSLSVVKSLNHTAFYNNYVIYLTKTKIVLYPDITQKDKAANLKDWTEYMNRYLPKYKQELASLVSFIPKIEKSAKVAKWDEVESLVQQTRMEALRIVKAKSYYTQTIMMEDLLSLVLAIEKTVEGKDDLKLMEQYQDFNSKFTFVIPGLIKSDVLKVGNLMDRIYKLALVQNMDAAKTLYQEIKPAFINAYRDYKVK